MSSAPSCRFLLRMWALPERGCQVPPDVCGLRVEAARGRSRHGTARWPGGLDRPDHGRGPSDCRRTEWAHRASCRLLYECRQDGPACSVLLVAEEPRSYVRRVILSQRKADPQQAPAKSYDVVVLALTTPYHPIRSGAYSLGEDYRYTVEAFVDTLSVLKPDGLLVVSRWLQLPPSESLRAFALAVEAVERLGGDPAQQIVGFRGYSMMTLLVRATPFTKADSKPFAALLQRGPSIWFLPRISLHQR